MKKLVIGLLIMLGVSTIGASASFGYVLKNEVKTHEISQSYELKKEALKNVYIESDIPFNLYETQGQPRVELNGRSLGVFIEEPSYNVDIREEGDTSYIRVSRNDVSMRMLLFNEEEQLDIYLSDQDMKTLEIRGGYGVDINIAGNYENVRVDQRHGSRLKMHSTSPAKVTLEGPISTELTGQFAGIEMLDYQGQDIKVESEIPTNINISSEHYSYGNNEIILKGAYKNINIEVQNGEVLFDLATAPERVNIRGDVDYVNFLLPKDIKGFKLTHRGGVDTYEETNDTQIYTDFNDVVQKINEKGEILTYGDQSTKLFVESYDGEVNVLVGR